MKKLRFITAGDERLLDEYIKNNRYRNIADNIRYVRTLGYEASQASMHRYMTVIRVRNNGQY